MLVLAVDNCDRNGSLAVLRNETVLSETGGFADEPYASRIFVDLQNVLDKARVRLEEIELFAVSTGPGSFTGLRVGLTAVKGWAEVFDRPIAAISGLEAVAVQGPPTEALLAPVMDARGGQVFGGIFRWKDASASHIEAMGEEVVLSADEFAHWVEGCTGGQPRMFLSPTVESVRRAWAGSRLAGAQVAEVSRTLAPFIGRLGYARARRGDLVDSLRLEANYVRRSDAEVNWKGE
jgi:tRNA threonylcarbamoyladenosine biosynthesis protein TsaB